MQTQPTTYKRPQSTRICVIDGCEKFTKTRTASLCKMHYSRWLRHGDTSINLKFGRPASAAVIAAVRAANTKHGLANSPTWESWHAMMQRTGNPKHMAYHNYGGRGITVCERWKTFTMFVEDMGIRPEGRTLDRWPDNDGNYEPGNCRWATRLEQAANKRRRALISQNRIDVASRQLGETA